MRGIDAWDGALLSHTVRLAVTSGRLWKPRTSLDSGRPSHSLDDDLKGTAGLSYRWLSLKGGQDTSRHADRQPRTHAGEPRRRLLRVLPAGADETIGRP